MDETWTLEEVKWSEPETRAHSVSVVDTTTGDTLRFNMAWLEQGAAQR